MTTTSRGDRLRELRAVVGVVVSYALGIGTILLVLFMFGVRPDNFARWLVSPVGLIILALIEAIGWWTYQRRPR